MAGTLGLVDTTIPLAEGEQHDDAADVRPLQGRDLVFRADLGMHTLRSFSVRVYRLVADGDGEFVGIDPTARTSSGGDAERMVGIRRLVAAG